MTVQEQLRRKMAELARLGGAEKRDGFWLLHRAGTAYEEAFSFYTCIDPRASDIVPRLVELAALALTVAEDVQRRDAWRADEGGDS